MQEKSLNNLDEELINKIVAVAYGDAGWINRFIINRKAKRDVSVQKLMEEYKLTADSVHQLEQSELPVPVMHRVRTRINTKTESNFVSLVYTRFLSKPILSAAVAGMIVLTIVSVLLLTRPQPQPKYTKAQLELAERQFKESLAIVGKVFSQAEKRFDEDVLNKQINKSLGKGFNLVNDILIGG